MPVKLETPGGSLQQNSEQESGPEARSDRPLNLEASLERGTRLLAILAQAARAARLEAEVAELQAALAEAHLGAGRRLERWLAKFDAVGDADVGAPSPVTTSFFSIVPQTFDARSSERDVESESQPLASFEQQANLGWAPYLAHARRRLRELQNAAAAAPAERSCEPVNRPNTEALLQRSSLRASAAEPASVVDESSGDSAGTSLFELSCDPERPSDERSIDRVSSQPFEEELPGAIDAAEEELDLSPIACMSKECSTIGEQEPTVNRPMLGGFGLSLVGHIALLAILFMITLRMPDQSASLASQLVSVSAPMDEVELTSQFESLEPIEMELDEEIQPNADSAELASSIETTALSEIKAEALNPSSLANTTDSGASMNHSAAAALSAALGNQGGGRSGGRSGSRGAPAMSSSGGKFFGAGAGGNFFCYVVDSSGSMRGKAWESAKTELVRSISTLTERQRFYIVFFAKEMAAIPEPGGREPAAHGLMATKENIEHARRWIETVKLDRGGPPNDALELAISREPDAIYLLTDGVTQVDVCAFLRQCNRTSDIISGEQVRVPIHAIAYHSLDGQQLLRRLAQENAGQFHYVPAPLSPPR